MTTQRNEKDFSGQNIFVGIDVHLKTWSVSVITPSGYVKTHAQKASAKELFEHLKTHYPNGNYHAVYESGFSGYATCYALTELGVNCIIVHAADVPTTQKEKVTKSDAVDSKKLALSLMRGELTGVYVHSKNNLDDRALMRHRNTIVTKMIGGIKSRIKHLLYNNGVEYPEEYQQRSHHWTRKFIAWLQNDVVLLSSSRATLNVMLTELLFYRQLLLDVNRKIRQLANSEKYAQRYENLRSIPGIGPIVAMSLLTEIEDIKRFNNERQFASYMGLVPIMEASGDSEYAGEKTFRGSKQLGPHIVESSWIAIRHDAGLSAKFGALCNKGMKSQEAIIRIARKLSNRIFSILKRNCKYECR